MCELEHAGAGTGKHLHWLGDYNCRNELCHKDSVTDAVARPVNPYRLTRGRPL